MKITPFVLVLSAFLLSSCVEKTSTPPAGTTPAPEAPPAPEKGENAPSDDAFIGRTAEAAAALAKERQLTSRILSVDGQPRPATKDYRPDRVNFEIEAGTVVKVSRG